MSETSPRLPGEGEALEMSRAHEERSRRIPIVGDWVHWQAVGGRHVVNRRGGGDRHAIPDSGVSLEHPS
jgi:hypothetical protein